MCIQGRQLHIGTERVSGFIGRLKDLPLFCLESTITAHVSRYVYIANVWVWVCVLGAEKDKHSKEKLFTLTDSEVFGTRTKRRKTRSGISLL